jgi:hypothetical protein
LRAEPTNKLLNLIGGFSSFVLSLIAEVGAIAAVWKRFSD